MEDEEEATMRMAADIARNRRCSDDVRRRTRLSGGKRDIDVQTICSDERSSKLKEVVETQGIQLCLMTLGSLISSLFQMKLLLYPTNEDGICFLQYMLVSFCIITQCFIGVILILTRKGNTEENNPHLYHRLCKSSTVTILAFSLILLQMLMLLLT